MEEASQDRRERLPSLTGLRFLAALSVFAFHASFEGFFGDRAVQDAVAAAFAKTGWLGVSFFFLLSGFVIAWSARPGDTVRRFWRRRLAKIWPSHLVTAVVAFGLIAATGGAVAAHHVPVNLLLLQSWVPRAEVFVSGNPVSWSLSCELFFYLAFPFLWRAVRRIRADRLWAWVLAVAAAVAAVPAVARLLPAEPLVDMPDGSSGLWQFWFVYVFPPVRALEFVLGMLMARIVREGRWSGPGPGAAAAAVLAAYVLALHAPYLWSLVAATVVPLALLIPAFAARDAANRGSRLSGAGWVRLGEMSFALYMVHRLVLVYGLSLVLPEYGLPLPAALALLAAVFAVSLAFSWVLFHAVERPAARILGVPRGMRRTAALAAGRPSATGRPAVERKDNEELTSTPG